MTREMTQPEPSLSTSGTAMLIRCSLYERWYLRAKQRTAYFYLAVASGFVIFLIIISILTRNRDVCVGRRGCPCDLIVPDLIHFYRADAAAENITRKEAACIRAALRLHGEVRVHSTYPLRSSQALTNLGLGESSSLRVMYPPRGPGPMHLAILREYGGIFLKNDIYLVSRVDAMRGHELCSVGRNDMVAGTREGAAGGGPPVRLRGVLLDKDYGALYIRDVVGNCTYSAVRLDLR